MFHLAAPSRFSGPSDRHRKMGGKPGRKKSAPLSGQLSEGGVNDHALPGAGIGYVSGLIRTWAWGEWKRGKGSTRKGKR